MPSWIVFTLFFLIIVLTHFLEGITGFGSTALAMPFLTILMGMDVAKPILTVYTLLLCILILFRSWRHVDWKNYGQMMGALLLGLPLGMYLYSKLPKKMLLALLSVFMIAVSIRGLLFAFHRVKNEKPIKPSVSLFLVFLGGIMHGAFSSGGPLIIIHATERMKDKSRFRATMCMIWLTLNTLLVIQMAFTAQFTPKVWNPALWGLPFLIIGTFLGDWAHKHIQDTLFTKLTFGMLLISGIFMAVSIL